MHLHFQKSSSCWSIYDSNPRLGRAAWLDTNNSLIIVEDASIAQDLLLAISHLQEYLKTNPEATRFNTSEWRKENPELVDKRHYTNDYLISGGNKLIPIT